MVAYGKCKCGPTPDGIKITATCTMKITFKRSKKALFSVKILLHMMNYNMYNCLT